VPAISEGCSRRVQEKKENCINIYIYVKRTILEAIKFVVWFIARVRQEGRLYFIRKHTMLRFCELPCNIRNSNIVVLFFQYFKEFSLYFAFELTFFKCFDRKRNTVPNYSTGKREGSLYIFSSNLFNIVIFISNRSIPVTVDRIK